VTAGGTQVTPFLNESEKLLFFMNEETGTLAVLPGGTGLSFYLPPWKSRAEDTTCSYPPQHIALLAIFILLNKRGPWTTLWPQAHSGTAAL